MAFSKLVSRVINRKISTIEERLCPDQYVGKISEFNAGQQDFPDRIPAIERPNNQICLIVILESPHKDEFIGDLGPAKGKTGRLIRKWIGTDELGLSQYRKYGLILVNAIQNQCSLGISTKCFRDEVFRATWRAEGNIHFVTRLKSYYQIGDVIVNCCTKGNDAKNELRKMVQNAIKENLKCEPLGRTHPASWYKEINRKYIWGGVLIK